MSEIKVNKISPRTACGTVTLGDSGDTFTIPSGATINNQGTATNFGATGSASWNTTVKTGDFTAVAGEGYFVNTTSGEVTVSLPAGTAGAVVAIKDYAGTFDTNKVTVSPNGSDKIAGVNTSDGTLTIETTPENNPNYFFDDYQREGDKYNKPNGKTIHMKSWEELSYIIDFINKMWPDEDTTVQITNYNSKTSISRWIPTKMMGEFKSQ